MFRYVGRVYRLKGSWVASWGEDACQVRSNSYFTVFASKSVDFPSVYDLEVAPDLVFYEALGWHLGAKMQAKSDPTRILRCLRAVLGGLGFHVGHLGGYVGGSWGSCWRFCWPS